MSRRNRANRFNEKSDSQDNAAPKIEPIDFEEADDEGSSYLGKVSEFCCGCWEKCTSFSKSTACKTWEWCKTSAQWTWGGIKAIPSYCVIRWDTGDAEDDIDEIESPEATAKIEPTHGSRERNNVERPDQPAIKLGHSAPLPPVQSAGRLSNQTNQYDEDELAPSRWWNLGIKTAAAAAAVLILVGGYFGVKSLFNTAPTEMADIEIVEPIEQPHLVTQETTSPIAPTAEIPVQVAPIAAVPEPARAPAGTIPPVAAPSNFPLPPQQQQQPVGNTFAAQIPVPSPPQGSFFGNDPLPVPQAAPTVAEVAPAIPTAPPVIEQPAPVIAESAAPPALSALQPLAPLESTRVANTQPTLQPLVALNQSTFPPTAAVADAPAAVPATPFAHVAANRGQPQGTTNPAFSQAPVPPSVNTLPQTTVERSIVIAEPMREVIPQIQHTGTIQNVPPPVVATPAVAEPSPAVRSMIPENSETAPAIPRDAPIVNTPPVVVVPAPAAPAASVAEFISPQVAPADTQPIDRQLWEQVQAFQRRSEAEPTQLRFNEPMATTEPALRFAPRNDVPQNAAPPAHEDNLLAREAVNSFSGLMPSPNSTDFAIVLPALENAPQPAWAELAPRYRDDSTDQSNQPISEGGLTFQSRIASEITRSPSAMETYTVQPGDTYMTISDRFYGTSLLYTALAQHNQQLGIGWRPAEGVVIEIPTAEFLRMHYAEATHRQERRLDSQRPSVRYIVQEGDTIFRLATDRLQDSTRWREIYAMNSDRLQDVRDLRPGMEILLPVETARRN